MNVILDRLKSAASFAAATVKGIHSVGGRYVTYPVLAVICAAAGSLYAFLGSSHNNGGHARHDAELAIVRQQVQQDLVEHAAYEDSRLQLMERAMIRWEKKQDAILEWQRVPFPRDAPPVDRVPRRELPGGAKRKDGGQ